MEQVKFDLEKWMTGVEAEVEKMGMESESITDEEKAQLYLITRSFQCDEWFRLAAMLFLNISVEAIRHDKQSQFLNCLTVLRDAVSKLE